MNRKIALALIASIALPCAAQNLIGSGSGIHRKSPPLYRVVNGVAYDANNDPLWKSLSGRISDITASNILISLDNGQWVIVKHYAGEHALDKNIIVRAMQVKAETWPGTERTVAGPYETFDCGTSYVAPKNPASAYPHFYPQSDLKAVVWGGIGW